MLSISVIVFSNEHFRCTIIFRDRVSVLEAFDPLTCKENFVPHQEFSDQGNLSISKIVFLGKLTVYNITGV